MKVIGITGGVGAGKSTVLSILKRICRCLTIQADDVAKELMVSDEKVVSCAYELFGPDAYVSGEINRSLLASRIYGSDDIRNQWNNIIHPATNAKIYALIDEARISGEYDYVFVEAALLIENHYDEVCDELWYVRASEDIRIERLMSQRGYTASKCRDIIKSQMSDEEFLANCDYVIDSGQTPDEILVQLQNRLEEYA